MCTSVYVNVYRRTTDTNTLPHFVPMDTHTHLHYMGSSHFKFNVFILSQILTIELKCSSWQCSIFPVASEWEGGCLSLCLKIPSGTRPERPVLVAVSCWGRRAWHGAAECSKWGDKMLGNTLGISLVVGSCPSAMGRLSCILRCLLRLNTMFSVKNKPSLPSLLFFATHILKINNDLLSDVLAAWTLSSLFASFLL